MHTPITVFLVHCFPEYVALRFNVPDHDNKYQDCKELASGSLKELMARSNGGLKKANSATFDYHSVGSLERDEIVKHVVRNAHKMIGVPDALSSIQIVDRIVQKLHDPQPIEVFLKDQGCPDEPAVDFAMQATGHINATDMEAAFQTPYIGAKISITNNLVSSQLLESEFKSGVKARINRYVDMIKALSLKVLLPDLELVVSVLDGSPGPPGVLRTEGVPKKDLLLPGRAFPFAEPHSSACNKGQLTPGAVFRGSTTGGLWKWNETHPLPLRNENGISTRYRIVELGRRRPELLNAGFSSVVQSDDNEKFTDALGQQGFMASPLTDEEQKCFQAVIVPDGNSLPDRLIHQLLYGTPIIFIHEKHQENEFWYPELIPWVHYVPSAADDLETTLDALLQHDAVMKCIGENGRRFVQMQLTPHRAECYMTRLLSAVHHMTSQQL